MHNPTQQLFHLGPGYWGFIPAEVRQCVLANYIERAADLIDSLQSGRTDVDRVALVVQTAAEATLLFFTAALHEPSTEELQLFFDDFVFKAVGQGAELEHEAGA